MTLLVIRGAAVGVLCLFAWRGHRWPIIVFMVLQAAANEIFVYLLTKK